MSFSHPGELAHVIDGREIIDVANQPGVARVLGDPAGRRARP
jgi:hypothetical protein